MIRLETGRHSELLQLSFCRFGVGAKESMSEQEEAAQTSQRSKCAMVDLGDADHLPSR